MEYSRHILQVFVGQLSSQYEALSIEISKETSSVEIVACITERLGLTDPSHYELAEVIGYVDGQDCKERRLGPHETPVALQKLWPQSSISDNPEDFEQHEYRFCLREKSSSDSFWAEPSQLDSQLIKDYFYKFLYQPKDKEYPDLCQLTNLNEKTLLENLKARFNRGHIYTYVGSILISVNPFKYYPIYNPKYVKLYQNHRLGELPPHIFAIADAAYHSMMKQRKNQCIVISGESGSGKTEATLFLLHHLTMLSQKGTHGSGVEQTILSSGPVLEAFGNAKTAHNNNSSRFGKFIQVSYRENGLVQGACVQKYLLEKSRICSQAHSERSYHVFYYLLAGASSQERQSLNLWKPSEYRYLNQSLCYTIDGCDEQYEFVRLKQSMEMVGFTPDKQHRLFAVLSAVLLLGNIEFSPRKSSYNHDESVVVRNCELASIISCLLGVSEDTLVSALTSKRANVHGEILVITYRLHEALAARDALAKCLYGALFDWIVLQVNYSLVSLKEATAEQTGNSIGVLDIFGFEDFGNHNRFEQFCINFANEHLQHYFNQHVFEYEQEEYRREGISWTNIGFTDNVACLALIQGKPNGLLCILDDQCSFPGATNETFLDKINSVHKGNDYYEIPQRRESAFIIKHYAGKVKYKIDDIREKNLDLMRPELISVLKNSRFNVVRELAGADPVAVFRWAILRAFFRAVNAFQLISSTKSKRGIIDHRKLKQKMSFDNTRILTAIENTQNRLRRTRHTRSRSRSHGSSRNQKNLKSIKALVQRTQNFTSLARHSVSRKSAQTVTGQFQVSLQALMEALNRANPYFIRCIKSNAAKEANMFDDELVQRQLRYTGMLETVRIRQAGFNVRMLFDEFIQHYRILLPKGLLSSQSDVRDFLLLMQLDRSEYQIGKGKIFMRESQKRKLDALLHQTILSRIVVIQRWYRTKHQRNAFLRLRQSVIQIQAQVRCWLAQQLTNTLRMQNRAATCIQRTWRGYRVRSWYNGLRLVFIRLQARIRGKQCRECFQKLLKDKREERSSSELLTTSASASSGVQRKNSENSQLCPTDVVPVDRLLNGAAIPLANTSVPDPQRTEQVVPQVAPPRRKSSSLQKKTLEEVVNFDSPKQSSDEVYHAELRRLSSDASSCSVVHHDTATQRRMSESALLKRNKQLPPVNLNLRRGDQNRGIRTPPPSSPLMDKFDPPSSTTTTDGCSSRTTLPKMKSFRHRQYQKVPDGFEPRIDVDNITTGTSATTPTSEEEEESQPAALKFPKLKHLKNFIIAGKPDEIMATESSDDTSTNGSSVPVTPTLAFEKPPAPPPPPSFNVHEKPSTTTLKTKGVVVSSSSLDGRKKKEFKNHKVHVSLKDEKRGSSDSGVSEKVSIHPVYSNSVRSLVPPKNEELKIVLSTSHHNLKHSQLRKGEICFSCDKAFNNFFVNQGFKCTSCQKIFHSGCVKNSTGVACVFTKTRRGSSSSGTGTGTAFTSVAPSGREMTSSPLLKKHRRGGEEKNWNLTRTSQFIDRSDEVVKDVGELKNLEEFIARKIYNLESAEDQLDQAIQPPPPDTDHPHHHHNVFKERKDSQVDQLFCRSLKAFKSYLVSAYSVASQNDSSNVTVILRYTDLIGNFEKEMNTLCRQPAGDAAFPITMGVNAFRGFLDEFIKDKPKRRQQEKTTKNRKRNRRNKKDKKVVEEICKGMHKFVPIFVNIYTQCEVCNSILWLSSKALTCQKCKVTCHLKCLNEVDLTCNQNNSTKAVVVSVDRPHRGSSHSKSPSVRQVKLGKVFGVPLENLVSPEEKVPGVVERIITSVELYGIYTEGLYRKSGASSKVREIKGLIDRDPSSVTFEDTPIHVLTSILKSFLRELPEPLLTYDAYDPLLNASYLEDSNEMFQTTVGIVHRLPKVNFDLLERLVFHLARVAQYEKYNRMTCSSLAIVFSPCVLRSPRSVPVQDSLNDISKQTQTIEVLISRQLNKVYEVLRNIETVEKESISAGEKLNSLRASKVRSMSNASTTDGNNKEENVVSVSAPETSCQSATGAIPKLDPRDALAVYKLEEQLNNFEEEKCRLTLGLTELVRVSSEEDLLLSTDMSHAGSFEDLAASGAAAAASSSHTTTAGNAASNRRSISNALSLDNYSHVDGTSRYRSRRKDRKSTDGNEDSSSTAFGQQYSEDSVLV